MRSYIQGLGTSSFRATSETVRRPGIWCAREAPFTLAPRISPCLCRMVWTVLRTTCFLCAERWPISVRRQAICLSVLPSSKSSTISLSISWAPERSQNAPTVVGTSKVVLYLAGAWRSSSSAPCSGGCRFWAGDGLLGARHDRRRVLAGRPADGLAGGGGQDNVRVGGEEGREGAPL